MAKKEKSRLIPAIDVLHEVYTGPRPEPERIEDVYQDLEKLLRARDGAADGDPLRGQ